MPQNRQKKWRKISEQAFMALLHWVGPQNPEPFVGYVFISSAREIYSPFYQHKFTPKRPLLIPFRNYHYTANQNIVNKRFRMLGSRPVFTVIDIMSVLLFRQFPFNFQEQLSNSVTILCTSCRAFQN